MPRSSVTLVLALVVAAAAILLAWQEGGGARIHTSRHRIDVGVAGTRLEFGRRVVLNGWDLPRAYGGPTASGSS